MTSSHDVSLHIAIDSKNLCRRGSFNRDVSRRIDKYVFPGLKAGTTCSNNTMLKLLKVDMGRKATVHGFRSTFRTWGQNETSIEREVLEYCRITSRAARLNSPMLVATAGKSARPRTRPGKRSATARRRT